MARCFSFSSVWSTSSELEHNFGAFQRGVPSRGSSGNGEAYALPCFPERTHLRLSCRLTIAVVPVQRTLSLFSDFVLHLCRFVRRRWGRLLVKSNAHLIDFIFVGRATFDSTNCCSERACVDCISQVRANSFSYLFCCLFM